MNYNITISEDLLHKATPNYSVIFEFEKNFDPEFVYKWFGQNWHRSFYFVLVYLMLIYFGRKFMRNRPRYELRYMLFSWNLCLATFSFIGSMRSMPELLHVLREFGFTYSVCNPSYVTVDKVAGFWASVFVLSKAPELIDTFFIVARKQKLIFLHLYHHISVLVGMWYGSTTFAATGRWFVNLNYFVHAWMYGYYALRSIGLKLPKKVSIFITTMQIVQMLCGIITVWWALYIKMSGQPCHITEEIITYSMIAGVSYTLLFVKFFIDAYVKQNNVATFQGKQKKS